MSSGRRNNDFPRGALYPRDATPRITPENAAEVIRLIGNNDCYLETPAIVIAVWTGGLVKYLVDNQQVEETIRRLREVAKSAGKGSE